MKYVTCLLVLVVFGCGGSDSQSTSEATVSPEFRLGTWRIVVNSPGGDLPLIAKFEDFEGGIRGTVINGDERLILDNVEINGQDIKFGIDHYESYFSGKLSQDGETISGEWTKVIGQNEFSRLDFKATWNKTARFELGARPAVDLSGRWQVVFNDGKKDLQAVAEFHQNDAIVEGTFMTPVGDYRFLEGSVAGRTLYLSCFDGGHMFLFKATLGEDGTLQGDFWSRDTHHETWKASRDDNASLPDPYSASSLKPGLPQFRFNFPNLDGEMMDQDHSDFSGKVRLITIFGSWCPNCNDEAQLLAKLQRTYRDRGFEVIGLAYEVTGDKDRDVKILNRFKKRHGVDYTILLAGGSTDKAKAAESLPDLDEVLSFPTTILLDREGAVVAVHSGFMGPGTGVHYEKLVESYTQKIESLL